MKHKICVYAISKNEEKFVDRWVNSMKEADLIIVGDTGSSDNTVEKLKASGVKVYNIKVNPWRFDEARNKILKKIPKEYDFCVCTDLDEVFKNGWKKELDLILSEDITRVSYNYNWSFDKYNKPATSFYLNKIHKNGLYIWKHPVHEVLEYIGEKEEKQVISEKIILNHYPDNKKSRSNYLELLELSVKEDPEDDRNMHYLGREYMYYKKWNQAIDTLIKHLELKKSTWKDERAASMRFIARSYNALNRKRETESWYKLSIEEAPYLREGYVELGMFYYKEQNYLNSKFYLEKALEIKEKTKTYINEVFAWDETIFDLLSLDEYYLENIDSSVKYAEEALKINPKNKRIKQNLLFFKNL